MKDASPTPTNLQSWLVGLLYETIVSLFGSFQHGAKQLKLLDQFLLEWYLVTTDLTFHKEEDRM